MKHWTSFLPDGPGGRYLRLLTDRSMSLQANIEEAQKELGRLRAELVLEEQRIEDDILKEWTKDEIFEAKVESQKPNNLQS